MLIDLSIALDNTTPAYPGDPTISLSLSATFVNDGYVGHALQMGTHTGTHIDAPAHMIEGGDKLGTIALDRFIGPGKLIEGFSIEAAQAAQLAAGDIALFYTGTSDRLHEAGYFTDYPAMDATLAEYLIDKGVRLVGVDTCSIDNSEGFPIHKKLLGAGIPLVENLTNLTSLRGAAFRVYALPLKLDDDGAPARVIAEVQS